MKESYHICFTSHDEVMFRDAEDHGMFVNLMALRAFATDTELLADAEMSTHFHAVVFAEAPMLFASALRMSYTKYFNHKYDRVGRMGQKYTFSLAIMLSRADIAAYLPRYSEFPDHWQMNESGVFTRQSFMEIRRAEQYYGTARNYLYQMNRLTDESWKQEQLQDNTGQPVTLSMLEKADEKSVAQMLNNEHGRNFRHSGLQDLDVCRLIDNDLLPSLGVPSVYLLTDNQRQRISRLLWAEFRLPEHQIRRCLGF